MMRIRNGNANERAAVPRCPWLALGLLVACLTAAGASPTSLGSASLPASRKAEVPALTFPLKELYRLRGGELVLRDQDYRPVRVGDEVFIIRGSKVMLLDTTAKDAEHATRITVGDLVIDPKPRSGGKFTPAWCLVAGLSLDGKVLAVADPQSFTGLEVSTGKRLYRKSMERILTDPNAKDPGATGTSRKSIGEGVFVADSVCVDLATGAVRWRAEPVDDLKWRSDMKLGFYPYDPLVILPDRVLIHGPAINIRTGKRLPMEAGKPGRIAVSHEQVLAMHKGGHHAIGQYAAALGVYPPSQYKNRLLAFDGDRLIIATGGFYNGGAQGPVEVVSIKTKEKLGSFLLGKDQKTAETAYALESTFDGNTVYVITSLRDPGWQMPAIAQYGGCAGLTVHRIDLAKKSGPATWTTVIDPDGDNEHWVLPMVLGGEHLAFKADAFVYVLDIRTGELKEKIDLQGETAYDVWGPIGPPVMTNGRLLVETTDGLAVYGPAK